MKAAIGGKDGPPDEHNVIESEIFLEIENASRQRLVVQRTVKGSRDPHLITVHNGPALTSGQTYETKDFFVGRTGAASREAGFHHFFASFLQWNLPTVQTYDAREYPLYLQCVFPYFFVEQSRGWGSIQPPLPTQFRIRDVHKRAVEFILNLDAHRVALKRQELRREQDRLRSTWTAAVQKAGLEATEIDGAVHGLPETPTTNWPPQTTPGILVPRTEQWLPATEVVEQMKAKLEELVSQEIPRVAEIASAAEAELSTIEGRLKQREVLFSRLLESVEMEREEVLATQDRIRSVEEDIQRNKDIQTLQQMGSNAMPGVSGGSCPTCHQTLQGSLIPLAAEQAVMSIDENIHFLAEQRRMYEGVLANSQRIVALRERKLRALRSEINDLRSQARSLRQTLVADGRLPSIAAIQTRIRLEAAVREMEDALEGFRGILNELETLSALWRDVQERLEALPSDDVTDADKEKLRKWTSNLRSELVEYDFQSLSPNAIQISVDSYRPEHEGFDLATSISASDLIRTIWSSLLGMAELAREMPTNHPGLVVFDEPKQQSAKEVSFQMLLRRASSAADYSQQVVFFTSEKPDNLRGYLDGVPHTLTEFEGHIIQKLG
jgi:predicted nuclease with TOPRIM domain